MVTWKKASEVVAEYLIRSNRVTDDLKGLSQEQMAKVIHAEGVENIYTLTQLNEHYKEARKWLSENKQF